MGKIDISDDVTFENGRALPGGWSSREIHYEGKRIGWLNCGYPDDFEPGFSFEISHVDEKTERCTIYKEEKGA